MLDDAATIPRHRRPGARPSPGPTLAHLCAVPIFLCGLVAAGLAGAQTVSPASIVFDPAAACGGGTDRADNVCITLPEAATCNTVDVFLLFDDTGSFVDSVTTTGQVFNNIVGRLRSMFPDVSFAFGVGRFEEFGGPWSGSRDRPFFLNQALLEQDTAGFSAALTAALSPTGAGPGGGGDSPETAIEALFQVATGRGFNGNPDSGTSLLDSGPAGLPSTWTDPGPSGDVPDFASYVGSASGTLGGAGWRPDSCLRLVLAATDDCTVAPFAAGEPIPDSIEGAGGTVATSAFRCDLSLTPDRFGPVAVTQDFQPGSGAVAPLGAATVADTVRALNDLGIRVIGLTGLRRGADPASPPPQPTDFLSALARLTGAVDAAGNPLVFDLGGDAAAIEAAITGAVAASVRAPIDIALVPDPALPGLTVTTEPPVREGVGPGEEACFAVTFEGDEAFAGGNLGLSFVDTSSGGSLGMTVPATLRCPDCLDLVTRTLLCNSDAGGFAGGFEWSFILRNRSDVPVHHLFFVDLPPGVRIEPRHLIFSPPIRRNQPRLVTVTIDGAAPGTVLDFRITLHDEAIDECCAEEVALELPACDCAQLRSESRPSCFAPGFAAGGPPWRYRFDLENLTTTPVDYLLVAPVLPADRRTPVSPRDVDVDPNVFLLDTTLHGGDESGPTSVHLSGPEVVPGEEVCLRLSTHDASFDACCSIVRCFGIPDCFFGPIDLEPLGSAVLYRSGDAVVVSDLGTSGDDGVAVRFAPAGSAEVAIQDPSLGIDLPTGAALRLAARGTSADGEAIEVAGVAARLEDTGVVVAPSEGAPAVVAIDVFAGDERVASSRLAAAITAVDGDWPTGFVMEDNLAGVVSPDPGLELDLITSGNVAGLTWSTPVRLRLGDGSPVEGDRVVIRFEARAIDGGVTALDLTARGLDVYVIKNILTLPPIDFGPEPEP